jgi:hypothetical protein
VYTAYFTNPGETSFRAYLTEQSFRQHLSRLDDTDGDAEPDRYDALDAALRRDILRARNRPPVHFASRAAVSLRTPRHVLHSCGVLTLGAVLPEDDTRKTPDPSADLLLDGPPAVGDAWYVGAFGRWWRGGVLDAWWLDAVAKTSSTASEGESVAAGILRMSTLDKHESECAHVYLAHRTNPISALPFSVPSPFGSSTRGRDRPAQETNKPTTKHTKNTNTRDTTPPPLPKSASLPLHTSPEHRTAVKSTTAPAPVATTSLETTSLKPKAPPSRTPSFGSNTIANANGDSSLPPVLAELARQVSSSKAATLELREQLTDADAGAARAKTQLEDELADHRARKKAEDNARAELKSKTKSLDDARRGAETGKREAERKLKAARVQRDGAQERMRRLAEEIEGFKRRGKEDDEKAVMCEEEATKQEEENGEEVERKKKEAKVAEDVVAALSLRAKELEEMLEKEKARLVEAREMAEIKRQDAAFFPMQAGTDEQSMHAAEQPQEDNLWTQAEEFNPEPITNMHVAHAAHGHHVTDQQGSPRIRPRRLSLTGISNFDQSSSSAPSATINPGYPINALAPPRFAPFSSDNDDAYLGAPSSNEHGMAISPGAQGLLSTSLVRSLALDTPSTASLPSIGSASLSMSTQPTSAAPGQHFIRSDDDPILHIAPKPKRTSLGAVAAGEWPMGLGPMPVYSLQPLLSPRTLEVQAEEDVFRVRAPAEMLRPGPDRLDSQRAVLSRTRSDPLKALAIAGLAPPQDEHHEDRALTPRRWFSVNRGDKDKDREDKERVKDEKNGNDIKARRGLNPDAKAFTLPSTGVSTGVRIPKGMDLNSYISVPHMAPGFGGFGSFGRSSSRNDPLTASGSGMSFGHGYDMLNPSAASLGSLNSSLTMNSGMSMGTMTSGTTMHTGSPPSISSTTAGSSSGWSGWGGILAPSFSMRAFAPSKAERVVLGRALGTAMGSGSSGSLERLPSLSAVGSLPGSPERNREGVMPAAEHGANNDGGAGTGKTRAWFQSLPRLSMNMGRKPKFSPFDDESEEERVEGSSS